MMSSFAGLGVLRFRIAALGRAKVTAEPLTTFVEENLGPT